MPPAPRGPRTSKLPNRVPAERAMESRRFYPPVARLCGTRGPGFRRRRRLSSADQLDDFEHVAVGEGRSAVLRLREDLAVALDGDPGRRDAEALEQVGDASALRQV